MVTGEPFGRQAALDSSAVAGGERWEGAIESARGRHQFVTASVGVAISPLTRSSSFSVQTSPLVLPLAQLTCVHCGDQHKALQATCLHGAQGLPRDKSFPL